MGSRRVGPEGGEREGGGGRKGRALVRREEGGTEEKVRVVWVLHDSPRAQTCTFEGPNLQNTTKISREDPQEREERMKIVAGE